MVLVNLLPLPWHIEEQDDNNDNNNIVDQKNSSKEAHIVLTSYM